VNEVLGFAGEGGAGLSVSGGRNLEERIGEEGGEKPMVPPGLCVGIRGISTSALPGIEVAVYVRQSPKNEDSNFGSQEVKRGELDVVGVVFRLSSCSAERMCTNLGSTFWFVEGPCLDTIVDALLDEEDDVAELKPSMVFNPMV
jgi:hypothetical protein